MTYEKISIIWGLIEYLFCLIILLINLFKHFLSLDLQIFIAFVGLISWLDARTQRMVKDEENKTK